MLEAVQKSALDPVVHQRLIADLAGVCEVANVSMDMVRKSAIPYLDKGSLEWLRHFPEYRRAGKGLLLTGVQSSAPDTKMMAICGALIRNFIDARIITLDKVIRGAEDGTLPSPSVLLIPNLFVSTAGKALPSYKVQLLYDVLLSRRSADKLTIAYADDMEALEAIYGGLFAQHLKENYKVV